MYNSPSYSFLFWTQSRCLIWRPGVARSLLSIQPWQLLWLWVLSLLVNNYKVIRKARWYIGNPMNLNLASEHKATWSYSHLVCGKNCAKTACVCLAIAWKTSCSSFQLFCFLLFMQPFEVLTQNLFYFLVCLSCCPTYIMKKNKPVSTPDVRYSCARFVLGNQSTK